MKKKNVLPILLSGILGITSVISHTTAHVYAQSEKANITAQYTTNKLTTITNGSGAIDASSDVTKFKNLKDFTMNATFTVNNASGVNSLFFMGNKDSANNYITVYINNNTLGVESRDANGNQQISNGTVKLTDTDLSKQHKLTFTMSGGDWVRFYVDGKLLKEISVKVNFSQGLFDSANYLGFGNGARANGMNTYPMSGSLQNIELYDTALNDKDILAYHQGALGNIAYTYENVYYPSVSTPRIHDDKNISNIAQLKEGSISTRFRIKDTNATAMSLFSFSDKKAGSYISLNIDPVQNKVILDSTIPSLNGKEIDLTNAQVSIKNTYWHTLTMTKDNSAIKLYLDGVYVDQITSGITEGLFNLIAAGDSIGIGYINRNQGDTMPFVGAIDYVKVYPGILDLTSVQMQDASTIWNQGTQIDMSNAYKTTPYDLFYSGYQDTSAYRIPSLLTTIKGTTLAMIDKRNSGAQDAGDIDTSVRRREKGQENFQEAKTILNLPENTSKSGSAAFTIDSAMVQDKQTGRIFAFVDMFPESSGLSDPSQLTNGTGYTEVDGVLYQTLYTNDKKEFGTLREKDGLGYVYDKNNQKTEYTVVLDTVKDHQERGNLYKNGIYKGNIYMLKKGPQQGELCVLNTSYLWMMYSDDDGKNWSSPVDISGQVKQDWMVFLGTGPGIGIQLQNGNLIVPVYSANKNIGGSQSSAVIISKDHGKTWTLGDSPQTNMGNDRATMNNGGKMFTESQVVQLNNGDLKLFMRNTYDNVYAGKVYMATSKDGGETWSKVEKIDINDTYCQLSVLHYTKDNKEYIIMTNPDHYPRTQGMVHLGEVQPDGSIAWKYNQILNMDKFQYSSLTLLSNDEKNPKFGLLYEDDTDTSFRLKFTEFDENFIKAPMETETMKQPQLIDYKGEVTGNTITTTLTFDQTIMIAGEPQLNLSIGDKNFFATYEKGSGSKTIVFTGNVPANVNGIITATGIALDNGVMENIHNLSFTSINVPLYDMTKITTGISIHDYSSQHSSSTQEGTDGAAKNVIDQNPNTYWHSTWGNPSISLPQFITLDLGAEKEIYKVDYLARQNSASGRVKDYEIALSNDGVTYKIVQQGELSNTKEAQSIEFVPTQARYVRFIAKSAYQTGNDSCSMAEMNVFEYQDGIFKQGDKKALINLLESVKNLSSASYSKATWNTFMKSIQEAQTLLDAHISSQDMLDDALAKVEKYKDKLIDITRVQKRLNEIKNIAETEYTATSWNAFVQELEAISLRNTRSVITIEQAVQGIEDLLNKAQSDKDVTDVLMQVNFAFQILVKKADKQELSAFVKQYENEALKEHDYEKNSWNTFMQAMQNAIVLLEKEEATQQEIDNSRNALIEARAGLQANKEALQHLYDAYDKLVKKEYTQVSWNVFETALRNTKKILNDPQATPSDVAAMNTALRESADSLIRVLDIENLQKLYETLHDINTSQYMEEGVEALQEALKRAEGVIKKPDSTQQIYDVQKALQDAYHKLVRKASKEQIHELRVLLANIERLNLKNLQPSQQKAVKELINQVKRTLNAKEISDEDIRTFVFKLNDIYASLTPEKDSVTVTPHNDASNSSTAPASEVVNNSVNTGDQTNSFMMLVGLIVSGFILAYVTLRKKYNNVK